MPRVERRTADLGYLFVMTYGRSGSTLLQGVLNTIPGYLIRGENRNALTHLHAFHATMLAERNRLSRSTSPTDPFYGVEGYPPRRALAGIRKLVVSTVLRPGPDTRVTGFKEIRWYHEQVEEYVDFLRAVFPGARFVVNTRNHDDVLRSKWWTRTPDPAVTLQERERRMLAIAESLGDAAYRVHYDDWVTDPPVLAGMYQWLGETYDEAVVREVLAVRHST